MQLYILRATGGPARNEVETISAVLWSSGPLGSGFPPMAQSKSAAPHADASDIIAGSACSVQRPGVFFSSLYRIGASWKVLFIHTFFSPATAR